MRKLKLFVAAAALMLGGGMTASAQTDVTASYIGDLNSLSGKNGDAYDHLESNGIGWWNGQTTGLTGWHAFVKNGDAYESWTGSFGGAGVMMGRTMVLPEGNYTLSFEAFACNATNSADPATMPSAGDAVAFLTGKDNVDITNTAAAGDATFHTVTYTFDVTTANTAYEFGIKKLTDESKIDWCQIKNVKLTLNSTNISPVDNSSINAFTYSGSQTWHTNTWSTEGQRDGSRFQVPFHELWVGSGNKLADATIKGTYTPTETGVYKVSAWVRAMNESGGAVTGAKIFVADVETDACTGSVVYDGKGRLGTYTAMADGVSGTPFEYGFKLENAEINWLAFKNVVITYLGSLPEEEVTALLAQVPTGKMNATVKSTLDGYVTALNTTKSVANFNNLSLYLPTAQASADAYVTINNAIASYAAKAAALDAAGQAAYDASGIQTKYDNGTYETLAEAEAELFTAFVTAVKAQTTVGSDWTGVIVNPSFESDFANGWTNNGMGRQSNTLFGKTGTYYAESWQPNGTKSVKQTISGMPAGVYRLTAKAKARGVTSAKLFAGGVETAITVADSEAEYTVEFACDSNADIEIGFEGVGTGAGSSWLCVDNFTMTLVSAGLPDVTAVEGKMNNDVDAAQTAAIAAYNADKTVANYNAASAAIAAAQASVNAYAAANAAIVKAEAIIVETNVFVDDKKTAYQTAIDNAKTAYNAGTMEDATASGLEDALNGGTIYKPTTPMRGFYGNAWTATNNVSIYTNSWSTEGNNDGSNFITPFIEDWVSDANTLANTTISASVAGLQTGTYKVTATVRMRLSNSGTAPVNGLSLQVNEGEPVAVSGEKNFGDFYVTEVEAIGYVANEGDVLGISFIVDGTNASWLGIKAVNYERTGDVPAADANDYAALNSAITAAEAMTLGFENGEYAPYNNVDAIVALNAAKAINQNVNNVKSVVTAATNALTTATWTANSSDVECVYNGNFAIGQGSPAADIQKYGWTRTNGWGQFQNGAEGDATNGTVYYNQLGSMQYGNAGVYTMPLKANTIYNLQFKYGKWDQEVIPTVSVLNGESGMAAMAFASTDTDYKTSMTTVDMVFVTGEAGDYVLTIAGNKNLVLTGVSITKAASQVLEFADGAVPTYAPGTYPAVKITRSLTGGNWATAVYPFAVSGVDKIAVVDSYDKTNGELKFKGATASEANVPFLMRSNVGVTEISLSDVAVEAAAAQNAVASEVSLIGVYAETNITNAEKNYVLSQNKIYSVGEAGAIIPVYRAYLQVEQPAGEGARTLTFVVDGETTAIEGVAAEGQQNGAVYNLNGQRVEKAGKGLYIQNGKKVVLK